MGRALSIVDVPWPFVGNLVVRACAALGEWAEAGLIGDGLLLNIAQGLLSLGPDPGVVLDVALDDRRVIPQIERAAAKDFA